MPNYVTGVSTVLQNLDAWADSMRARRKRAGEKIAILLAAYAQAHHGTRPRPARWIDPGHGRRVFRPAGTGWGDVTGATQQSTKATISRDIVAFTEVALFAGMEYDVFLELARNGRWAWLWPALIDNKDKIVDILETELNTP